MVHKYKIVGRAPTSYEKDIDSSTVRVKLVSTGKDVPDKYIYAPEDIVTLIGSELESRDREYAVVIYLAMSNRVQAIETVAIGAIGEAAIHPREVFKGAILANAAGIIFVHNHPGGNAQPSKADREAFDKLKLAADILQVQLIDCIIIGDNKFYSNKAGSVTEFEIKNI